VTNGEDGEGVMLVLTRKPGQRVLINPGEMGQVSVTVERLSGGGARLSFQAPRDVVIHTQETWDSIVRGRRAAR